MNDTKTTLSWVWGRGRIGEDKDELVDEMYGDQKRCYHAILKLSICFSLRWALPKKSIVK